MGRREIGHDRPWQKSQESESHKLRTRSCRQRISKLRSAPVHEGSVTFKAAAVATAASAEERKDEDEKDKKGMFGGDEIADWSFRKRAVEAHGKERQSGWSTHLRFRPCQGFRVLLGRPGVDSVDWGKGGGASHQTGRWTERGAVRKREEGNEMHLPRRRCPLRQRRLSDETERQRTEGRHGGECYPS